MSLPGVEQHKVARNGVETLGEGALPVDAVAHVDGAGKKDLGVGGGVGAGGEGVARVQHYYGC